jgi:hypothetical protein
MATPLAILRNGSGILGIGSSLVGRIELFCLILRHRRGRSFRPLVSGSSAQQPSVILPSHPLSKEKPCLVQ